MKKDLDDKIEFNELIYDIKENEYVKEMQNYRQHFNTNCYDHCMLASYYSYKICKKLHLDYKSMARAAMLHDMFLYDWRKPNPYGGLHAFTHGKVAYENASKIFTLNKKEKDIIIKHMWPICFGFPIYPETFILTLVDKYCAFEESCYDVLHNTLIKKN